MRKSMALSVFILSVSGPAWGQAVDAALRDRVAQLVERLNSPKMETGKAADIIAVNGDPLADVTVLKRVGFVMKDGRVHKDQR